MASNGRRPHRPDMMPGGGAGQGGWVPGVSMPPLGYGLVAQQPHMAPQQPHMTSPQPLMAPQQQAWQQQQQQQHFLAQQAGLAGMMGIATLTQQQQQQHQQQQQNYPPQHVQQQWMEAQRKAAEDQRKLYEQMMKQRQFDEQKMRLKAFNASKKTGVSADTMIESILGGKEHAKPRSPQPLKKSGGGVEDQGTQGNHHHHNQAPAAAPTSQAQTHRLGTAVDWTKLENVNTLFASPKKAIPAATTTTPGTTEHPNTTTQPPHDTTTTNNLTSPRPQAAPHSMGDVAGKPVSTRKEGKSPILVPQWMKDSATIPEVYKRAVGLVGAAEGWVDTSRAYMLLMKTGLPPPFLGVLWEMVNCTTPGQLTQTEFSVLLALVAVVQSGQPITGPEVLNATQEPVMPLIDHPALAPLVQDYLQARQQQAGGGGGGGGQPQTTTNNNSANGDDDEFDDFVSVTVPPSAFPHITSFPTTSQATSSSFPVPAFPAHPQTAPGPKPPQTQPGDKNKAMNLPKLGFSPEPSPTTSFDDDFDDFQSAALPCIPQAAGGAMGQQPKGGQGIPTTTITTTPTMSTEQPPPVSVLQPEKSGKAADEDKYAVFREIAGTNAQPVDETENPDDSFGEFCSSEVASLSLAQNASSSSSASVSAPPGLLQCQSASGTSNTSPISFEVYSTPPEALPDAQTDAFEADFSAAFASTAASTSTRQPDNYADIHEAMKRAEAEQKRKEETKWSDPFGEFEEAPPPLPPPSATSAASTAPPTASFGGGSGLQGAMPSLSSAAGLAVPWGPAGVEEDNDEDFGDFMGHSGIGAGSSIHTLPPPLENLGETQSVASLELPGLEMTVGVEGSETQGGTDLFAQPRTDLGTVEDQLSGLHLDTTTTGGVPGSGSMSAGPSATQHHHHQGGTAAGSVMDSYCGGGGLVDKYSIIREEASRDTQPPGEAHTGSWERCLEGIIKVLQETHTVLTSLNTTTTTTTATTTTTTAATTTTSLKSQVLATSQMQDYLTNVYEVWLVCGRIRASSRRVTTSVQVDTLLSQAQALWRDILAAAGADSVIAKPPVDSNASNHEEGENQMAEGEVCGVCLTGGGNRLTYGGHSYHPPCANLWLNCVDLLLPSLTPVTLL